MGKKQESIVVDYGRLIKASFLGGHLAQQTPQKNAHLPSLGWEMPKDLRGGIGAGRWFGEGRASGGPHRIPPPKQPFFLCEVVIWKSIVILGDLQVPPEGCNCKSDPCGLSLLLAPTFTSALLIIHLFPFSLVPCFKKPWGSEARSPLLPISHTSLQLYDGGLAANNLMSLVLLRFAHHY